MKTLLMYCWLILLLFPFSGEELKSSAVSQINPFSLTDPHIEIIALFSPSENSVYPGIISELKSAGPPPQSYFWKLSSEHAFFPTQFREAPRPVFYFPNEGLYSLKVYAIDENGRNLNALIHLQVSKHEIVVSYPQKDRNDIIFSAQQFASPAEVWNLLELTGSSAKPASILGQPWYVVAGGGAAAAGIAVVLWSDQEEDKPPLIANNVNIEINCLESAVIFPLLNDQGEGLFIQSINGLPADIGEWIPPDQILIYKGLKQDLNISYSVADQFGQEGTAQIIIRHTLPPLELQNKELGLKAGETAQLNLLENAICSNCRIIDIEQPLTGSFSLDENLFIYTSETDYGGSFQLKFTVEDECGQQNTASVFIEVIPECDTGFSFEKELPDCGLDNGRIQVVADQESDFSFLWENGSNGHQLQDLNKGEYHLTITDERNGCEYLEAAFLDEKEAEYVNLINTVGGNCLNSADAEFEFSSPKQGTLNLSITGESLDESTEIPLSDQINLSLSQLWTNTFWQSGNYELRIFLQEAGSSCVQALEFILDENPTEITANNDEYSIASGLTLNGNILENDVGTALKVSFFDEPDFGSLAIEENGGFSFESMEDETGTINIEYEVTDSCGYTANAFLIIEVFPCILDLELEITHTPCGENTGTAEILINEPDLYEYEWSTTGSATLAENLAAGNYTLTVTETSSGCIEVFEFEIQNLPPTAITDSFQVFTNDTLIGNLLLNDIGSDLTVIDFGPITANLDLGGDGTFTYLSTPDFTGSAEYWYLIEDACGGRDSGLIFIQVLPISCVPEVDIQTDSTTCGLAEAMVVVSVKADCEYKIIWHDDSKGDTLFNQAAGDYELIIITGGGVFEQDTLFFNYTIFEKNPEYIQEVISKNPSCFESGEIWLELNSVGAGEYKVTLQGPLGLDTIFSSENVLNLGENIEMIAGDYLITVKDLSLECELTDSLVLNLEVDEITLELINDTLVLFSGESISFDLFENDIGTGLRFLAIEEPPFGSLTASANGKGSYSVNLPDHGMIILEYSAKDTCDQESTAILVIEVILPPCEFEVAFEKTDSDCGYDNGSILTTITPASQYSFLWNTGAETKDISGLSAGIYTLTVADELRLCSLEFQTEISEKPTNWIQSLEVVPEGCALDADIILELLAPENDQLNIIINGGQYNNFQLTVPQGLISLNDYIGLTAGLYFLDVTPVGSQNYCTESTSAQITFSPNPVNFSITQVIPPSSPQSANGEFSIEINGGFPPYDLFLNDEYFATTSQATYTFTNLSEGTYEVEVVDAQFCSSGTEQVNLSSGGSFWLKNQLPTATSTYRLIFEGFAGLIEFNSENIEDHIYFPTKSVGVGLQWASKDHWLTELQFNQITVLKEYHLGNSKFLTEWNKITIAQLSISKTYSPFKMMDLYFGLGSTFLQKKAEWSSISLTQPNVFSFNRSDHSILLKGGFQWNISYQISLESGVVLDHFFQQKRSIYLIEAQFRYEF